MHKNPIYEESGTVSLGYNNDIQQYCNGEKTIKFV